MRQLRRTGVVAAGAAVIVVSLLACRGTRRASGDVSRNWRPAVPDTVLGVASTTVTTAIGQRLSSVPPTPLNADQWRHVNRLYASFQNAPLWLSDKGVHQPRVRALLLALANADSDALRLDAYPLDELGRALHTVDDKSARHTPEQIADADVLLSSAFVQLGENMLTGQLDPRASNQNWHIDPTEERVDSALTLTLREDDFSAGLARMRPQDPAYDSLRVAFARFRQIVAKGGWDSTANAKAGGPAWLRARLTAEGYLDSTGASLANAITRFQTHHGIAADGAVGKETLDALSVPARYRLEQIAANLERYRWLPRNLGTRYIIVNIPEFRLAAYDAVKGDSIDMKVIVGQEYEDKATPVFSDSMEFVVFRPYWLVTPTIAAKEIFPKEAANPGYIAASDMEVYDDHGRRAVRQRPGPKNSLGLVKFLFPNDYNVYLHDTPNGELFKKDMRAFSHGCIRVEKPGLLAQWVLGWPDDRVSQAMQDGPDDHQVRLPQKIPVYIVYFTAYLRDGELYFGNDLYSRDQKLIDQMANVATLSPQTVQAQAMLRALAAE